MLNDVRVNVSLRCRLVIVEVEPNFLVVHTTMHCCI